MATAAAAPTPMPAAAPLEMPFEWEPVGAGGLTVPEAALVEAGEPVLVLAVGVEVGMEMDVYA